MHQLKQKQSFSKQKKKERELQIKFLKSEEIHTIHGDAEGILPKIFQIMVMLSYSKQFKKSKQIENKVKKNVFNENIIDINDRI
jgi:hypothetical protein